jgi:hypothetical protein
MTYEYWTREPGREPGEKLAMPKGSSYRDAARAIARALPVRYGDTRPIWLRSEDGPIHRYLIWAETVFCAAPDTPEAITAEVAP